MRLTNFLFLLTGLLWLFPYLDSNAQKDTYDYCTEYFEMYGTAHPIEGVYSVNALKKISFGSYGIRNGIADEQKFLQADGYICVRMNDDKRTFAITISRNELQPLNGTLRPTAATGLYIADCHYPSGISVSFNIAFSNNIIEYSYQQPRAQIVNDIDRLNRATDAQQQVNIMKQNLTLFHEVTAIKMYPLTDSRGSLTKGTANEWKGNGSGIIMSPHGHVITNFHVVEDADQIELEVIHNGKSVVYEAAILQVDKVNDLAILKVVDVKFDSFDSPPFSVKFTPSAVGTRVYAYGYPMALSAMGKEVKVTDGIISAKTGFNGDITTYQISAPIQGGNSGGPLFDAHANLIGINSSGLNKEIADNVGYSIKTSYVRNVFDVLPKAVELPNDKSLQSKTLVEQIAAISPFVVLVKVR